MFGSILNIENNIVWVDNLTKKVDGNILSYHVVFEENNKKIVGEVIGITDKEIKIVLVGEIRNNLFVSGVVQKPSHSTIARLIYKGEVEILIGNQNINIKDSLLIGKSNIYEGYNVTASMTDFFSNHFAIVGNTGSGKSCGVARLLQNIFYYNKEFTPVNSRLIIFDIYGEYNMAFEGINKIAGLNYKKYTTKMEFESDELIQIPTYFLDIDDLALLLDVTDKSQLPIIEKALKLVYIFNSQDPNINKYKNDIIAKSLLDILSSGKNATQKRDQIIAILTTYNTDTLKLETVISQPGYNRTVKQCLNVDNQGMMGAMQFLVDFLEQFTKIDLEKINLNPEVVYTLDDLYYALEFALINEGILSSEKVFEKNNVMKTRLHAIINSEKKAYFDIKNAISKDEFISNFFETKEGYPAQIVNLNFSYLEERFAKVLTKIYAKLFFNYVTRIQKRGSFPIHMILEEAHRYVQIDSDLEVLGYNIFDRITKEGRKYGIILGFVTQRPSELSTTALSQCANFLVFRMFHPEDLRFISDISTNLNTEILEKIKLLRPGMALVFGTAFNLAQIVHLELPVPAPESNSVEIKDVWYRVSE